MGKDGDRQIEQTPVALFRGLSETGSYSGEWKPKVLPWLMKVRVPSKQGATESPCNSTYRSENFLREGIYRSSGCLLSSRDMYTTARRTGIAIVRSDRRKPVLRMDKACSSSEVSLLGSESVRIWDYHTDR
ncbi:Hypothetical protein NTJ_05328 [Nesidiocoris tenuis]|uniref:Uncharacterized protein n=1 Tax=Nesidiocoris tenuis TaxID=355587 RepID=A0ABN7AJT3_9HEMI|nr:Hypothetical protein NTJ_05328 [Nesidiocoris tenuis]